MTCSRELDRVENLQRSGKIRDRKFCHRVTEVSSSTLVCLFGSDKIDREKLGRFNNRTLRAFFGHSKGHSKWVFYGVYKLSY